MKTTDLFKNNRAAKRINESLAKTFGRKLNLESFDLPKLEDARNKLRTQVHTARSAAGFNETLENDAVIEAQWILDAINSEIAERQEFISAPQQPTVEGVSPEVDATLTQIAGAGDDGYEMLVDGLNGLLGHDVELFLQDMYDNVTSGHPELHPDDNFEEIETIMMDQIEKDFGRGTQEHYGEDMTKVTEGEIQQASAIVTAKTMVDRVGRWIEELSGMENDTLLTLGDSIRDEMGQEQAKQFISSTAPAIRTALENLRTTREALASSVRSLTGEEQSPEMLGGTDSDAGALDDTNLDPAEPDAMNPEDPFGDEFDAAEPAIGGAETAGRAKRESIDFGNRLMKVLAG